jgi:hypothetical protein
VVDYVVCCGEFFVTGVYVVFKQSLVSSSPASPATTAASSSSASHLFAILWMLEVFSGSGGRVKRGEEPLFCGRDLSGQFLNAQIKPWALKPNKVYFLFLGKIISKNIYDL